MDHVVDGRTTAGLFVGGAEELRLLRSLHGWTGLFAADVLEGSGEQVELEHELPNVLVFPDILIDLLWLLDYPLDVGRIVS